MRRALTRVAPQGGNTLLDALVEASRDLKRREGERTGVVAVTGSGPGFTNYERRQVVDLASGGGTVFWGVQFEEGGGPGGDAGPVDYQFVLSGLAEKSGGRFDTVLASMAVDSALQKVAADLGSQYQLSYATVPELKDRKLEVKVARPGARIRIGPARP
jgi:hypothetical protein